MATHKVTPIPEIVEYLEKHFFSSWMINKPNRLPLLVGSRALVQYCPSVSGSRLSKADWDFLVAAETLGPFLLEHSAHFQEVSFRTGSFRLSYDGHRYDHNDANLKIVTKTGQILEFEILSAWVFTNIRDVFPDKLTRCEFPFGPCEVAPLPLLAQLKFSHLQLPINWWKHVKDLSIILKLDPEILSKDQRSEEWGMKRAFTTASLHKRGTETMLDIEPLTVICPEVKFRGIDLRKRLFPVPKHSPFLVGRDVLSKDLFLRGDNFDLFFQEVCVQFLFNLLNKFPHSENVLPETLRETLEDIAVKPSPRQNWFSLLIVKNLDRLENELFDSFNFLAITKELLNQTHQETTPNTPKMELSLAFPSISFTDWSLPPDMLCCVLPDVLTALAFRCCSRLTFQVMDIPTLWRSLYFRFWEHSLDFSKIPDDAWERACRTRGLICDAQLEKREATRTKAVAWLDSIKSRKKFEKSAQHLDFQSIASNWPAVNHPEFDSESVPEDDSDAPTPDGYPITTFRFAAVVNQMLRSVRVTALTRTQTKHTSGRQYSAISVKTTVFGPSIEPIYLSVSTNQDVSGYMPGDSKCYSYMSCWNLVVNVTIRDIQKTLFKGSEITFVEKILKKESLEDSLCSSLGFECPDNLLLFIGISCSPEGPSFRRAVNYYSNRGDEYSF